MVCIVEGVISLVQVCFRWMRFEKNASKVFCVVFSENLTDRSWRQSCSVTLFFEQFQYEQRPLRRLSRRCVYAGTYASSVGFPFRLLSYYACLVVLARTYVVCGQSVGDDAGVGATECNAYVSLRSRPSWFGRQYAYQQLLDTVFSFMRNKETQFYWMDY